MLTGTEIFVKFCCRMHYSRLSAISTLFRLFIETYPFVIRFRKYSRHTNMLPSHFETSKFRSRSSTAVNSLCKLYCSTNFFFHSLQPFRVFGMPAFSPVNWVISVISSSHDAL